MRSNISWSKWKWWTIVSVCVGWGLAECMKGALLHRFLLFWFSFFLSSTIVWRECRIVDSVSFIGYRHLTGISNAILLHNEICHCVWPLTTHIDCNAPVCVSNRKPILWLPKQTHTHGEPMLVMRQRSNQQTTKKHTTNIAIANIQSSCHFHASALTHIGNWFLGQKIIQYNRSIA